MLERTFATALGVGVGDRVTLDGQQFTVAGIAVTAAAAPYPNLCYTSCMFTWASGPTACSSQPPTSAWPGSPRRLPGPWPRRRHP